MVVHDVPGVPVQRHVVKYDELVGRRLQALGLLLAVQLQARQTAVFVDATDELAVRQQHAAVFVVLKRQ